MFGNFSAAPAAAATPAPAAPAQPTPTAGFGPATTTTNAATAANTTPQPSNPTTAPHPAARSATTPAAAPPAPATPAPTQPPAPPTYAKLLEKAQRDGAVSEGFVQELKKRFSAPMEVKAAPATAAAATTTAASGAAAPLATAQQLGAQWKMAVAPQATLTASTISGAPAAGTSALARTTEAQQQQQQRREQAENAQNFLELLLLCDSGYNNSEAPPADNPASSHWVETEEEQMKGLHAAVAAIAAPAASNLISFVKAAVVKHSQALDGDAAATGLFGDTRRKRSAREPAMLAAQCLYVLSRHFQLTASVVKEALELVEALYLLLKNSLRSRTIPLATFSENPDTAALNSLMWLCVFSVVNMTAVWKKLRGPAGELRLNDLVQSNVASSIEATVTKLRGQMLEEVQRPISGLYGADLLRSGGSARTQASSPLMLVPAVYTWHLIVDSYLSILTLAEGCLLRAKGNDQGYDKAMDAFLGERMTATSASSPASAANLSPASVALHRGKVTKRMVELAPVPRTLAIPVGLLYIAPYEIMSYLFDEMLLVLRCLSDLEVATHKRYIEQLEDLPRISAAVSGGRSGSGGAVFQARAGRLVDGDGDDGWLRRMTRVGLHGEVVGEPFTSEMAHLLEALAICLQHLPPEVLNPDLDSDCAATFFIFKNFVKHMRQVFATQRTGGGDDGSGATSSAVWENYTLKLMTKFLEVLAMIGRNPQYTQRVVVLLTDAQTECSELQWHSLVGQALECAGFNSGVLSVPGTTGGSGMSLSAMAAAAAAQSSASPLVAAGGSSGEADGAYAASSTLLAPNGAPRILHRQFTRLYARKCQRHFISSFFLLLRQLFAHPALRNSVNAYINLELALTFLSSPVQSQVMLGSTLSLISALITNAADAQLVWSYLEQKQLLQQTVVRTQHLEGSAAQYDRFATAAMANGGTADTPHEPTGQVERLSLTGHCQYECSYGTYDVTIGFLHLITALFQHDQPSMAALSFYTAVTKFIAHDVLRGVMKRGFEVPHERYTVFALASAALRQALQVCFHGENGRTTMLPFATVMAVNKAPADVVGEVVKLILEASDAPYELLSHHRAAVRQALLLLITAIQAAKEQKIELLLFDTRTTLNTDLAVRVLGLCSLQDTLLTRTTLQLLLQFPAETANQAAQYWSGLTGKYAPVLDAFTHLLHPLSVVPIVVQAPPELAQLDFSAADIVPGWPTSLLIETKSLLLDLLMQHADVTEPSLTAWMCGFYSEEFAAPDGGRRRHGAATAAADADPFVSSRDEPSWWRTTLLTSVVEAACSAEVEHAHPALAVKCVKLLYLLRANRLYGALVVRPFLESVCQTLFLHLQHFRASQCTPVALSKYAYVLKLLALEACYTYRTSPDDLKLSQSTSIPSIAVEVLLSLLLPFGTGGDGEGDANALVHGDSTVALAAAGAAGATALGGGSFGAGSFAEGGRLDDDGDDRASQRSRRGDLAYASTIVSRDAAADIASWLPQALQVLPTFPEKLPPVTGGRSHLTPCAADGVVQYNMASLFEAFQLEQIRAHKPALTTAELGEKLRPFIAANDCFFSYAAGVSFVEGWCQLVSVACSVVQGLSMSRLRAFASCILRGLDATTALTAAAQEQVSTRLCYCLSTVMAHLRETTQRAVSGLALAPAARTAPDQMEGVFLNGRIAGTDASRGALQHRSVAAASRSNHALSRRRPRDETGDLRSHGNPAALSNPFTTQAGEASNFYSASRRSQLAQTLLQRSQAERVTGADDVAAAAVVDVVAGNAVLLQPLVRALVQWGTRIATIRPELYLSLLCLAETPGVSLDDVVLWRSQRALLEMVCADICSGCAASAVSVVPANTNAVMSSVGDDGAAPVSGGALSPPVQHAVALLVALLQASAPIRDDFCNSSSGSGDEMGTWATRCTTALLQSVDAAVCGFFANNGAPLGSLLWHIRSTFDLLSVVTLGHASQILHSDLLRACFAMQAWTHSTQVVLGYAQASFTHEQMASQPLVEQNKEVLRRLLLGVTRWVNLLLSFLGDAAPLLYEVQKFIRDNRSLIDFVFISPAAVSSTLPGSARLSASHLTLCAEMSDCLRALSNSVLATDCRVLVDNMALPDLLNMLSSEKVWRRGPVDLYNFADLEDVSGLGENAARGARVASGSLAAGLSYAYGESARVAAGGASLYDGASGLPSDGVRGAVGVVHTAAAASLAERGRDVVALTVRNLAHLLLNAEYGLCQVDAGDSIARGMDNSASLMLRFSAGKRNLCIQIVRHVAHAVVDCVGAPLHEFRLECFLYALHALVCLLHSFVLPVAEPLAATTTTAEGDFALYLKELPLKDLAEVLTLSHDAVYQLKAFNTDYRGGIQGQRIGAEPWAAALDAAAREDTDGAAAQSLSNGMRHALAADADATHPITTPKSTPAAATAEAFSVPSTPGLLPAAEGRRGGRDSSMPSQPVTATAVPGRDGRQRHSVPSAAASGPRPSSAPLPGSATGHSRDPNSTVVQSFTDASGHGRAGYAPVDEEARWSNSGVDHGFLLSDSDDGERLRPDSTLWDLLPSRNASGGDAWTRVYDSYRHGEAAEGGSAMSNGVHHVAASSDDPLQWEKVLNVENEVRQVKIAIANALRATNGAMELVRKMN